MKTVQRQHAALSDLHFAHYLAHSHKNHVAETLATLGQFPGKDGGLLKDLCTGEVPGETHLPRGAEGAAHPAACLAANACRSPPVGVGHEDRLDELALLAQVQIGRAFCVRHQMPNEHTDRLSLF